MELELSPRPHVDFGELIEQDVQRDLGLKPDGGLRRQK
jgi:hypothetical protein